MTRRTRAITRQPGSSPDAGLLALVKRYDDLWANWTEEAPRQMIAEACDLERIVVATPVFTAAALAAKCRVIERAEFDDADGIIAEILRQDAKRVAA